MAIPDGANGSRLTNNRQSENMTDILAPRLADPVTSVILDSISDGVFTVDHDFRITYFNKAAEEITGFPREKAIGQLCQDIFRANMCAGDCALKKTMTEGRALLNSLTHITDSSGRIIPISLSTSLLKDQSGKILGGVETFRDRSIVEGLRQELAGTVQNGRILTRNKEMKQLLSLLENLGNSETTVLIEGETGTGKELLAHAIHSNSLRKNKKFVAINCGALPDTLLESELFGYKAGAFTGAQRDKQGLFASAGSGTILLDEIGDTSPAFQVKLLRLLEEKAYHPLGSVNTRTTEARIIAATNRNLQEMVAKGSFRQDLFYRINVVHLKLPPLRRRPEDIPLLVEHFISKMNAMKGCNIQDIAPDALLALMAYDYPGNIRELENIIEHAFVVCRQGTIDPSHLPENLGGNHLIPPAGERSPGDNSLLSAAIDSTERKILLEALRKNQCNRTVAARELGMHKSTLYRKMKKLGLSLPETDGRSAALYQADESAS